MKKIVSLALAAALTLSLAACGTKVDEKVAQAASAAAGAASEAAAKAGQAAGDVAGKASELASQGVDAAGKGVDAAGKAVEGAAGAAAGAASDVAGKASELADKGMEAAGQGVDAAGKAVEGAAGAAAGAVSGAAAETKKLTGKVTVYMPSPAGLADELKAGFEAATGVTVEAFQGTTGEILARLEAEKANPVADVVILASWSDGLNLKANGNLLAYTPKNTEKMNKGFVDSDKMLYGSSASAVGVIYNTTLYPKLEADWAELADAKYKDNLAFPDPEKSGSAKDFIAGYITAKGADSWKVWEDLAANGMTIPGANKAALEAVMTASKGILIAGVDYNAFSSKDKGEPIDIYYPAGGTVVNPRPAMIMKDAPNADNAKAFMDYLLSDEAQAMVVKAYLLPGRVDVEVNNRTPLRYIPQITVNWDDVVAKSGEIASKMLEICK